MSSHAGPTEVLDFVRFPGSVTVASGQAGAICEFFNGLLCRKCSCGICGLVGAMQDL